MAEHRERVDQRTSREIVKRVIVPLCLDLGARYLRSPSQKDYDDEEKTLRWNLGYKKHGDKRMRTEVTFQGIQYRDGDSDEGRTRETEMGRRIGWSRKHDNRLVQNDETVAVKIASFEESFNRFRSFSSADLSQRLSASAQGEIMGIGGSVTSTTEAKTHTELEAEKLNRTKKEIIIDDSVRLFYPGPIRDDDGRMVEEGEIWLVDRPVSTIHTVTPMVQWGIWDARILLNIEDWAGYHSVMPKGEHWNILEFTGLDELAAFMQRDLVLRHPWSKKLKLSDESKRGLKWMLNPENRRVGPVEWERITVSENVSALEPSIVTPN